MRKFLLGDPRVVGKKSQNLSCWLACGSWGGILSSWRLAQDQEGPWKRTQNAERRGWEQGCTSRLRKGVAAGEKLEILAALGSRTVQHSHSAGEAPNKLLSLLALGPLLSASGSRSCPRVPRSPPLEVTPTALIIFCFAPGLFSTTNFQQSPWRRAEDRGWGGGGGCSDLKPESRSSRC